MLPRLGRARFSGSAENSGTILSTWTCTVVGSTVQYSAVQWSTVQHYKPLGTALTAERRLARVAEALAGFNQPVASLGGEQRVPASQPASQPAPVQAEQGRGMERLEELEDALFSLTVICDEQTYVVSSDKPFTVVLGKPPFTLDRCNP